MRYSISPILTAFWLALLLSVPVAAQNENGAIRGIAYFGFGNEAPRPVSGAEVKVTGVSDPKFAPRKYTTDGGFLALDLAPGTYRVEASVAGMMYVNPAVEVKTAETTELRMALSYEGNCNAAADGEMPSTDDRRFMLNHILSTTLKRPAFYNMGVVLATRPVYLSKESIDDIEPTSIPGIAIKPLPERSRAKYYLSTVWSEHPGCVVLSLLTNRNGTGDAVHYRTTYLYRKTGAKWTGKLLTVWQGVPERRTLLSPPTGHH